MECCAGWAGLVWTRVEKKNKEKTPWMRQSSAVNTHTHVKKRRKEGRNKTHRGERTADRDLPVYAAPGFPLTTSMAMGSSTDEEFKEKLLWNVKREAGLVYFNALQVSAG